MGDLAARKVDAQARRLCSQYRCARPRGLPFVVQAALCRDMKTGRRVDSLSLENLNARARTHLDRYRSGEWYHHATLRDGVIELLAPTRRGGSRMSSVFGSDRFLRLSVYGTDRARTKKSTADRARFAALLRHGVWVGRRHFRPVGLKCGSYPHLSTILMFAVTDLDASLDAAARTVRELWAWCGNFTALPPAKALARIALLFSTSVTTLRVDGDRVALIDDVRSDAARGGGRRGGRDAVVLTDGCGFIAPSLLAGIRGSSTAIVQIRVACSAGLFKGTLVAAPWLDDDSGGVLVQLRPSMRKLRSAPRFAEPSVAAAPVVISVVASGGCEARRGALWKTVTLLLWQRRGVPQGEFIYRYILCEFC